MSEIISLFTVFSLHLSTTNAPAVLSHCVRSACDDRGRDDAKHITLDDTRWELSHGSKVLQYRAALANTLLGIL